MKRLVTVLVVFLLAVTARARLGETEAEMVARFGAPGRPFSVHRTGHSLALAATEGGSGDSIAFGSACSVGHRIEAGFTARSFRVFGGFRGFAGLDFPGWACRLDFGAERAGPSGG